MCRSSSSTSGSKAATTTSMAAAPATARTWRTPADPSIRSSNARFIASSSAISTRTSASRDADTPPPPSPQDPTGPRRPPVRPWGGDLPPRPGRPTVPPPAAPCGAPYQRGVRTVLIMRSPAPLCNGYVTLSTRSSPHCADHHDHQRPEGVGHAEPLGGVDLPTRVVPSSVLVLEGHLDLGAVGAHVT